PDPVDVRERAVQGRGGSEEILEEGLDPGVEIRRLQLSPKDRNAALVREVEKGRGRILSLGDEDDRDLEREEELECRATPLLIERVEEGDLGLPKHLDTVRGEALDETGQHQPRARDVRLVN